MLFTGRDYPKGYEYFRTRCNAVFRKNKDIDDPRRIEELLEQGEFVVKELKALYFLRKYRSMMQRYYPQENVQAKLKNMEQFDQPEMKK